ncbi:SDR family oxidoreductase [Neolewinella persica]|uniref:SDR family oxidoreductase n=1 Tax=Neolewinella persica TaxID=70998 RepID=UPI00037B2DF5|nr:SDR family oxidoreductase [Neolewinella persica]
MADLTGKIALVTGGGNGIGLASARALKAAGATVVTAGRNEKRAQDFRDNYDDVFDKVYVADAGSVPETNAFVEQVGKDYGRIDVIFANAGFGEPAPLGHITEENFDKQFNVNVKGVIFTVQAALPYLNEGASIVLNSSIANQLGFANFSVYAATKGAVKTLGKIMAAELVGKGIRVNVVSPGPIDTGFFGATGMDEKQQAEMGEYITNQVPMRRFGKAEEIGSYVAFLAGSGSTFMTGTEVEIDGGMATL